MAKIVAGSLKAKGVGKNFYTKNNRLVHLPPNTDAFLPPQKTQEIPEIVFKQPKSLEDDLKEMQTKKFTAFPPSNALFTDAFLDQIKAMDQKSTKKWRKSDTTRITLSDLQQRISAEGLNLQERPEEP